MGPDRWMASELQFSSEKGAAHFQCQMCFASSVAHVSVYALFIYGFYFYVAIASRAFWMSDVCETNALVTSVYGTLVFHFYPREVVCAVSTYFRLWRCFCVTLVVLFM